MMSDVSIRDFLSSKTAMDGDPHIGSGQEPMMNKAMLDAIDDKIVKYYLLHKGGDIVAKWLSPREDKKKEPSLFDKAQKYSPLAAPIVLIADYKGSLKRAPKSLIRALSK